MEELASKLAELLNITVKSAVELYPLLRRQYMWYAAIGNVMDVAVVVAIIAGMLIFLFGVGWIIEELPNALDEDEEKMRKLFIVLLKTLIAAVVVAVISRVTSVIVAPDLNFILRLLGK